MSSRLERLVVQRVRRRSFLSNEFTRRGRMALGALDPDAIEELELEVRCQWSEAEPEVSTCASTKYQ